MIYEEFNNYQQVMDKNNPFCNHYILESGEDFYIEPVFYTMLKGFKERHSEDYQRIIDKMIEVVKGYVKHEQETLFKVIQVRENMNIKELKEANSSIDEGFNKVNALVENYPNLKADENFKVLQKTIVDVEEHLQAARRMYNSNVSLYNQLVESFPTNVIANANGMKKRDFFEAENKAKEKVNVKI